MFKSLHYLRNHAHPHGGRLDLSRGGKLLASDAILGSMAVLLVVVAIAYAIDLAFF